MGSAALLSLVTLGALGVCSSARVITDGACAGGKGIEWVGGKPKPVIGSHYACLGCSDGGAVTSTRSASVTSGFSHTWEVGVNSPINSVSYALGIEKSETISYESSHTCEAGALHAALCCYPEHFLPDVSHKIT